jgi:hypothetical protein
MRSVEGSVPSRCGPGVLGSELARRVGEATLLAKVREVLDGPFDAAPAPPD